MINRERKSDIYHLNGTSRWSATETETAACWHSRRYHAFFEGFTESKASGPNGKQTIRRVYTAPWCEQGMAEDSIVRFKAAACALYLLAAAGYLWCMSRPVASNRCDYVAAPGLLCAVAVLLLCVRLGAYLFSGRRMTKYEYRHCVVGLYRLSAAAAACLCATAAAVLFYAASHRFPMEELQNAGLLLAAAAVCAVLCGVERKIPCRRTENDNAAPEGGCEIR